MTDQEIAKAANEAGIDFDVIDEDEGQIWYITKEGLNRFAALVAASEREACARVCEDLCLAHPGRADLTADQCAAAIRARQNI